MQLRTMHGLESRTKKGLADELIGSDVAWKAISDYLGNANYEEKQKLSEKLHKFLVKGLEEDEDDDYDKAYRAFLILWNTEGWIGIPIRIVMLPLVIADFLLP